MSFFPEAGALRELPFPGGWYDYLDSAGIAVGASAFVFAAIRADAGVALLLDVGPGAPVMLIDQVIRDVELRPFNFAVMYFR